MSMFFSQQPTNGSLNGSLNGSMGAAIAADSGAANGFPGYSGGVSNSMLSYGLNLSRENVVNPAATVRDDPTVDKAGFTPNAAWTQPGGLPPTDEAANMARWDPQTRFYMLITEMLAGLEFKTVGAEGVQVSCRDKDGEPAVLLDMTRPPRSTFDAQMARVFTRAAERNDRTAEILTQVQPQFAYWGAICNLHPSRTSWTIELTTAALHFSMLVCQRVKHMLACPRPVEYSSLIQPIILTPAYGTYPMGHATEAYMFARIMTAILKQAGGSLDAAGTGAQLQLVARRIADNRVISGVHFPVDTAGGYVLAEALADHVVGRLQGGKATFGHKIGGALPVDWDDDPANLYRAGKAAPAIATKPTRYTPPASPILDYMFMRAQGEFVYASSTKTVGATK